MPSLHIATAQLSFQNHLGVLKSQALIDGKSLSSLLFIGNEKRSASAWKSLKISEKLGFDFVVPELPRGALLVRAVATLEPKVFVQKEDGKRGDQNAQLDLEPGPSTVSHQSASEDLTELEDIERLRRMRISQANKGNTPWNKGRKHSAETIQRIRERTKLAMQDPKVKMKLVNLGHAQSKETRKKIGVGVRMGWQKRRVKLILQETCHSEWQNLIAEASRSGYNGEEELQWGSYKILDEQLEKEWLESVELRKTKLRPKGSKRAPKSPEQRRKIAEAIAEKWADPEYRNRVCSGLAKYHGVPVGSERKPRRKSSDDTGSSRLSSTRKRTTGGCSTDETSKIHTSRVKKSKAPLYKEPLATSKLEIIKKIRAQRAAAETKKTEAIEHARLLIAEAKKAAKALEVAAMKSPIAQASLVETRKLIAEAIQSIESAETAHITFKEDQHLSVPSVDFVKGIEHELRTGNGGNQAVQKRINGHQTVALSDDEEFSFNKSTLQKILISEVLPTSTTKVDSPSLNKVQRLKPSGNIKCQKSPQPNGVKLDSMKEEIPSKPVAVTKKWIRGKLVELTEKT